MIKLMERRRNVAALLESFCYSLIKSIESRFREGDKVRNGRRPTTRTVSEHLMGYWLQGYLATDCFSSRSNMGPLRLFEVTRGRKSSFRPKDLSNVRSPSKVFTLLLAPHLFL